MVRYVKQLERVFRSEGNAGTGKKMAAYLKNRYPCLGIKTPERRKIGQEFIEANGLPSFEKLKDLTFDLFELPEREFHHFAIELYPKYEKQWQTGTVNIFEKMAVTKSWWDTVDSINGFCIRPYFKHFPQGRDEITQKWINSDNMWLQRLSVICQLRLKDKTDRVLLTRNILQLNDSDEFFIQKAIGWALRDYWRTDPDWVRDFVYKNDLRPLSAREALKHD